MNPKDLIQKQGTKYVIAQLLPQGYYITPKRRGQGWRFGPLFRCKEYTYTSERRALERAKLLIFNGAFPVSETTLAEAIRTDYQKYTAKRHKKDAL